MMSRGNGVGKRRGDCGNLDLTRSFILQWRLVIPKVLNIVVDMSLI